MTIARHAKPRSLHAAPALRFLALFLGAWVAVRVAAVWNPVVPPPPTIEAPWVIASPFAAAPMAPASERRTGSAGAAQGAALAAAPSPSPAATSARPPDDPSPVGGPAANMAPDSRAAADRHSLRLALMARLLPAPLAGQARTALPAGGAAWWPVPAAARAEPGHAKPFWMQRQLAGWSLGGWLYLRRGDGAPGGIASPGQLGGSQAGLRLAYGLDESGRMRAYGRATMAVQQPRQRELALGLTYAPVARWPVDVSIERRIAAGPEGRSAMAAMVSGGVSSVALPGGFRLDAYGQAGVVGLRRRDGFVDGAMVVDRRLGDDEAAPLRLGALAAGAAQPGAARVDIGPRLTLRLPDVGEGGRIALDWRQRVAGDAAPESGVALTLAADF
ncbi:hypothetical protein FHR22_002688 [Sphingopyxis panaciterrae]|uniref:hypothetical protein n=1 Tax=Sphingopyxis panaciterrae TaxID=363841 RepID=UPI00141F648D|nr:hypothetical protein [Sphingopyxis panaciterrae]NIJ37985.1 hypothetical protein [Sphingopyxis panaciterrae]